MDDFIPILCSVYFAIESIGVRTRVWINGAVITGRAASTVGVAASAFASCGAVAKSSTGASLSVVWFVSSASFSLAATLVTCAAVNAGDSTRLTSRRVAVKNLM